MFDQRFSARSPLYALLSSLRALAASAGILALALAICMSVHHAPYVVASDSAGPASANVVRSATDFDWRQSPSSALNSPGQNSITLDPCPPGVIAAEPWFYVYISGAGNPEAARVTGGTCKGDNKPGTLQFTTASPHPSGYTVGSASTGLQEASIASRYSYLNPPSRVSAGGRVIVPSAELNIYARVSIRASNQTIDFSGSVLNCYTDDTCIFVGDPRNSNSILDVTLINPKGQPMIVNDTKPMIETNGQKTRILNVSARTNSSGGTFGTYVQVDDDQSFLLDGLDSSGYGVRCDATFCGAYVTAPGPFNIWSAVGWLKNLAISNQCHGNGVDWQSGNTLHIEDSVIQGFNQFGVRAGTMRGGYGPTQLTNVYMEVGGCTNPQYPGKGAEARAMAGLINEGGIVTVTGDMYPIGQVPQFSATGTNVAYYWIVVKDSAMGSSVPLPVGFAQTDGKRAVNVAWPKVHGTKTITYDLLKTTGTNNPWLTPTGTGMFAVSTGIAQCGGPVCTAIDPNGVATNYVVTSPSYHPKIDFWPGGIVQSPNSDSVRPGGTTALFVNSTSFASQGSPFVNLDGIAVPTVYASQCGPGLLPNTWVTCLAGDSVGNNAIPAATVLQYGIAIGGDPANRKGRLIFGRGPLTSVNTGHYITLVDSDPTKTLNTRGYRPLNDKADTYIGLDNASVATTQAQLAFGAPISISNYIGNEGDGKAWGERLTAKQKTFAVPVVVQPGSSFTLGAGSALSQLKIFKTDSVSKASVPAQQCLDVTAAAFGLTTADQITGITPPASLGNLSLNAYAMAADRLVLHFCNPSTSAVNVPAGAYSFLAVH
jgi:hypothetical protein